MTFDDQASNSRSDARLHFAERLRMLRIPRGFRTARSFAKALSIDENRYTRYERAEVEPDLGLIRRICALLAVTPDELLGVPARSDQAYSSADTRSCRDAPLADYQLRIGDGVGPQSLRRSYTGHSLSLTAWAISGLVANARQQSAGAKSNNSGPDEAFYREASAIFSSIVQAPETALRQLANEAALIASGPETIREFVALREHFSDLASK